MTPKSRGHVRIVSPDPAADPLIDHGYLTDGDDHDLTVLRDGLALAEDLLDQPALAEVLVPAARRDVSDDAIRRDVQHYYRPVGTTPMGTDPATSVCDPRGRVHGVDGLVVADVSLMPQIPRANTNIPAVMMGERILTEQRLTGCCAAVPGATFSGSGTLARPHASSSVLTFSYRSLGLGVW